MEDSRGEEMCSTGFAWRSDQGQVYPGVPHPDLTGVASPLAPFGLSSNISKDPTHPRRAFEGPWENGPAKRFAIGTPTVLRAWDPVAGIWGAPLENPESRSRHSLPQDSGSQDSTPCAEEAGDDREPSALLWPAPIFIGPCSPVPSRSPKIWTQTPESVLAPVN